VVRRHDGVISPRDDFRDPAGRPAEQTDEPRLTVGFAMSEPIKPEEIGYTGMISKVADAVKVAMERAGITDAKDVHYVQTKTPSSPSTRCATPSRGERSDRAHPRVDGPVQRTGLGIAVALGEIDMPTDADVMHDRSLYSSVARAPRASVDQPSRRGRTAAVGVIGPGTRS
jgi:cyanuric acid amidohydrolase